MNDMGIFDALLGKVKETRTKNIERRERVARVKQAMKAKGTKETDVKTNRRAKAIQKKYNVSYEDALEFSKQEQKDKARKAFLERTSKSLTGIGSRAKTMTTSKMGQSIYQPRGVSSSSVRSSKKLDVFKPIGKY